MSALNATRPTLLDIARRLDPDGKIAAVAEVLNEFNEVLDDIPFVEGNLPTGHKVTVRSSLPTAAFRKLNQGTNRTKSTTEQVTETCGIMDAYSEIDEDVALINGNVNDFRFSEDLAHIESLNQKFCTTLIYGDTSDNPEEFLGIAPRYVNLSGDTTSDQIIDAGAEGSDNTSIYLVGWHPSVITGIYPKGSQAGLKVEDKGKLTVYDSSNNPFEAFVTHYKWKCGIAIKDYRCVIRIANIDISDLETADDDTDDSANILKYMSMALDKLPPMGMLKPVFYCNNRVRSMIRVKLLGKANTYITLKDWQTPISGFNRPTLAFQGVPIRRVDAITNTETLLT